MAQSASPAAASRGSLATLAAFALGVPLGVALLWLIQSGPWQDDDLVRYTSHPVEQAEVILFCCAVMALAAKVLGYLRERMVFSRQLLPRVKGQQPASDAGNLLNHLAVQRGWRGTWLGQRVNAILEFVHARGAANELDDQLRTLSDSDAMSQDGSYSLIRFINWAIPILGFLGTVVGITDAIAGVTPEILEKSLNGVTSGLATAFDTTALALGLTMILMFGTFATERLEQSILENVDAYVERHLAHRFERTGAESGQFIEALRKNSDVLLQATEQLVERQAKVWTKTLEKADRHWAELGKTQETLMTNALSQAFDFTLRRYGERLAELEQNVMARNQAVVDGMTQVVKALEESSREHRAGLSEIANRIGVQAETLARMQEGEAQLIRHQETLQQNLSALRSSGAFDEAVQSLTAAIHLLTARAQSAAPLRKAA